MSELRLRQSKVSPGLAMVAGEDQFASLLLGMHCAEIVERVNAHAILTQQRDELTTCLNDVLNMLKAAHMQIGMRSEENPRVIRARAALAKVKP